MSYTPLTEQQNLCHHHSSILVVDDDEFSRKTIIKFLSSCNYNLDEASNGREALDTLAHHHFDLVITDIRMPVMDGRELLRIMSENYSSIPRIVLTAHDNEDDVLLALKTGAYDYMTKPIMDFNLLKHSVKRALEKRFLQEQRDKTILQMEHVNNVISMLNRGNDFEEIFGMLCDTLRTIVPFDNIIIFDFKPEEKRLSVKMVQSSQPGDVSPGEEAILSDEYAQQLAGRTEVMKIDDPAAYMETHNAPDMLRRALSNSFSTFVSTPLVVDDCVRGFLVIATYEKSLYTQDHARFLSLIAGQVAFSLQRGELLSDLSMHTKHLEKMVKVRTHEIVTIQKTTIFALSKLAEIRDNDTGEHLDRMRNYSILLAQLLKYSGDFSEIDNEFLKNIYDSSILHDIGKVGIPDSILLKPAPLTPDEFDLMKGHTTIGHRALEEASEGLGHDSFLAMSKDIALYHHERWDGKGYPEGKTAQEIPLSARIVTIGDIYDALTTNRPYKTAFDHDTAISIMKDEFYRFDPRIIKVFLENHTDFDKIRQQFS